MHLFNQFDILAVVIGGIGFLIRLSGAEWVEFTAGVDQRGFSLSLKIKSAATRIRRITKRSPRNQRAGNRGK